MGLIYTTLGTPTITGIIRDFTPTDITSFTITATAGGNTATNPNLFQYTLPTPISTTSIRALQFAITVSGGTSVNIYSLTLGYN